ncbi:MAG: TetR/AcrR family transcriptional regulator [Candidatus Dormibacteraeota bacterium]|uniref:TetR/AcrR family transcriptional regulator n=1 Tax=Candidatus Amunia macphersoniae TaxID=3127014 RepID=A0A934NEB1_9BACT|nr:TetR/AcrR family transcriptional regulator [Candidatus Dormibacteraeota bacterium]
MVAHPTRDRRAERREATRAEILDAAWELARIHGLAGISLREVARRIGIQPPTLYWYFDSKNAIYDAMFAEANRQLLQLIAEQEWPTEPREMLRMAARVWVAFSTEDVARYQLMFQRSIPDFEPSPEAYAVALEILQTMRVDFAAAGISDPAHLDLWTAVVAGLAAQQTSNQPGGDRWLRLTDEAADMFADHVLGTTTQESQR